MLPKCFYDAGYEDLRMRVYHSLIDYNNTPAYVVKYGASKLGLLLRVGDKLECKSVELTDPGLCTRNLGNRLGLHTNALGTWMGMRVPLRQFCQGLNQNNSFSFQITTEFNNSRFGWGDAHNYIDMKFKDSYNDPHALAALPDAPSNFIESIDPNVFYFFQYTFNTPGFIRMWRNDYPKVDDIDVPGLTAISRLYAINVEKDKRELYYLHVLVGAFDRNCIRLDKNKQFLAQNIERNLGIRVV